MGFFKLIVDLLAAYAWPITLVLLVKLGWDRREQLVNVLNRLHIWFRTPTGIEGIFGFGGQPQHDLGSAITGTPDDVQPQPLPPHSDVAVRRIEAGIHADLQQLHPQTTEHKERVLVRALAENRVWGTHEYVYNRIFGSQIAALRWLNEFGAVTMEQARAFLEPYTKLSPQLYARYGFESWLGFLKAMGLIDQQDNGPIAISDFGRSFLTYLPVARLTENKLG